MNIKVIAFATTLLFCHAAVNSDQAWSQGPACDWQQVFCDTTTGLPDNYFGITNFGNSWYLYGENGAACKSVNGGQTWATQPTGSNAILNDAFFFDENNGLVVGGVFNNSANILRTTDGGLSYTESVLTGLNNLFGIHFIDANNGWTFGVGGLLLRTTDGGNTWLAQPSSTTEWLLDIAFVDQTTGVIVGGNGTIRRTTNGGLSWLPVASGTGEWITGVAAPNNTTLIAVGNGGTILRSGDSGQTWTQKTSGISTDLSKLSFRDENTGTAVGNGGTILSTIDAGETWIQQNCNARFSFDLRAVLFAGDVGLAVGEGGGILRTDATPIWYVDNSLGQNGDGSIASPFNNKADAESASGEGDTIFLHSGSGPYDGVVLKDNQDLYGQGVPLELNGRTLVAAGTPPVISNPGGIGVTLANNNYLGGLTISDVDVGISGTDVAGEFDFLDLQLSSR